MLLDEQEELASLVELKTIDLIERETRYVFGKLREKNHPPVLAVVSRFSGGWKCRSIYSDVLRHDYASRMSIQEVVEFMLTDIVPTTVVVSMDRSYSLERLGRMLFRDDVLNRPRVLCASPTSLRLEAAEVVLSHLETAS